MYPRSPMSSPPGIPDTTSGRQVDRQSGVRTPFAAGQERLRDAARPTERGPRTLVKTDTAGRMTVAVDHPSIWVYKSTARIRAPLTTQARSASTCWRRAACSAGQCSAGNSRGRNATMLLPAIDRVAVMEPGLTRYQ